MSIADKLTTVAENVPKVYEAGVEAGQKSEYDRFWDAYQDYGNRTNYRYAFAGAAWNKETLKPKYPIRFKDANTVTRSCMGIFYMFSSGATATSETVDWKELNLDIDFSNCLTFSQTFANSKLDNIDVDCSSAVSIANICNMSDSNALLTTFRMKITDACTDATNAFRYCSKLENLSFHEGSCIACNIDLLRSTSLTHDSIVNVINTLSSTSTGKTLSLSSTAVNTAFETSEGAADGSTSEEWTILVASKSNWTISLS